MHTISMTFQMECYQIKIYLTLIPTVLLIVKFNLVAIISQNIGNIGANGFAQHLFFFVYFVVV